MARKLQPDYIEWVLKLNATQAQEEYHKLEKANRELKSQTDAYRKQLAQLTAEGKKNSVEWQNLDRAIRSNSTAMSENRSKMQALFGRMDNGVKTMAELRKSAKSLQRELDNTSKSANPQQYERLRNQLSQTKAVIAQLDGETKSLKGTFFSMNKMKETLNGFFFQIGSNILNQIVGAFKTLTNTVMEFSAANSRLAAILGTTKEGIASLTEQAKELGRTTTATASQVTSLQTELAKLGFAQQEIENMTPAVLKFAKSVGTDLGSAAAFAGASLRIFGKDSSDTKDVLATLAISTNKSALDFSKLQASMATIGPVAASFGLSIEDTTALLGTLANAGFDASSAATATRNILLNLCDANGDLAKALGGPVTNLDELAAGLDKLNAEGIDLAKTLELTDKRSVAAFSNFLKQSGSMVELRNSITGVNDEFDQMSKTMADNAKGAQAGFESAVEGLVLRFGGLDGIMQAVYNSGTVLIQCIGGLIDLFTPLATVVMWCAEQVGALFSWFGSLFSAMGNAASQSKFMVNVMNALKSVMVSLISFFATWKLSLMAAATWTKLYTDTIKAKITALWADVKATMAAKTATEAFNRVLKSNPIMFFISLITSAIAGLVAWKKASKESAEASMGYMEKAAKRSKELKGEAIARLETEKRRLEELIKVAKNEAESKERRLKAINALNKIVPQYNAHLDTETGKYVANKKALDAYLVSLQKKLVLESHKKNLQELVDADSKKRVEMYDKYEHRADFFESGENKAKELNKLTGGAFKYDPKQFEWSRRKAAEQKALSFDDWYKSMGTEESKALDNYYAKLQKMGIDLSDLAEQTTSNIVSTVTGGAANAGKSVSDAVKEAADKTVTAIKSQFDNLKKEMEAAPKENNDALKKSYDDKLAALDAFYDTQEMKIKQAVQDEKIAQGQADLYLLSMERSHHKERLKALLDYQENVKAAESMSEEERKQALDDLAAKIRDAQNQILTDTGKWSKLMREATTNALSPEGLKESLDRQVAEVISYYDTLIAMAKENGAASGDTEGTDDTVNKLQNEKNRRVAALNYEYKEKMWGIKEQTGLSWVEEYKRELDALKHLYDQGVIDKEQFEKAKFNLAVKFAKKEFDYYSGMALSTFSALQDAEIAKSDAKYDVLIQQAKNNGEDTAALEQEKENKKLEIQKKYADVNFAIKISQIIADTAVSIMQAFSQLGPIGGAIAAVMLTATGVAQVISAKAERDKIKKMKPGNTGATGSVTKPASAERVLTGYAEGGYTGDGDRYEVAGVVHRGEYVVPKPIMKDRRVIDAVGMIEAIRAGAGGSGGRYGGAGGTRSQYGRTGGRYGDGFADGGYTGDAGDGGGSLASELRQVVGEFREATRGLRAYVVYSDIEDAKKGIDRARAPFTR